MISLNLLSLHSISIRKFSSKYPKNNRSQYSIFDTFYEITMIEAEKRVNKLLLWAREAGCSEQKGRDAVFPDDVSVSSLSLYSKLYVLKARDVLLF